MSAMHRPYPISDQKGFNTIPFGTAPSSPYKGVPTYPPRYQQPQ